MLNLPANNSNLFFQKTQDVFTGNYSDSFGLDSKLESFKTRKTLQEDSFRKMTSYNTMEERVLYDILRLSNGEGSDVLDDANIILGTQQYSSYNAVPSLTGNHLGFCIGDVFGSRASDSINLQTTLRVSEQQRQYLETLYQIVGVQGIEGVKGVLINAGYPDNEDTLKQAELILNNIVDKHPNLQQEILNSANRIQEWEKNVNNSRQLITTRAKSISDNILKAAKASIGNGGGQGQ